MQTRQTIAVALMAFASIANCQMTPIDTDTECNQPSSTAAAASSTAQPSTSSAPVSTPVSHSSAAPSSVATPDPTGAFVTFSYVVSSGPSASSTAASHPSPSSSPPKETTSATKAASSSAAATATATPSPHAAVQSEARRDAIQTLYMNARSFIVNEAELEATINREFADDRFSGSSSPGRRVQNIWDDRDEPISVATMLNELQRNHSTLVNEYTSEQVRTTRRQKLVAEELTGGKMDDTYP
ncbi:hypothetical protein CHU98_g9266 [Xylaria longipes]|nr:hypothetical protein CHU98_g9266 [Xylaria longipes]